LKDPDFSLFFTENWSEIFPLAVAAQGLITLAKMA